MAIPSAMAWVIPLQRLKTSHLRLHYRRPHLWRLTRMEVPLQLQDSALAAPWMCGQAWRPPSALDGTPNGNSRCVSCGRRSTQCSTSPSNTGALYTSMFTSQIGTQYGGLAPTGYTLSLASGYQGGYNAYTAWAPYTAGTYSATWPSSFIPTSNQAGTIILAMKGFSQAADTGDHQQCASSTGALQCGITGAGDVFVINTSAGLILKDTVAGTCSRIQLTSGVLTPTVVTCPN